jgi:hypothetical protein
MKFSHGRFDLIRPVSVMLTAGCLYAFPDDNIARDILVTGYDGPIALSLPLFFMAACRQKVQQMAFFLEQHAH